MFHQSIWTRYEPSPALEARTQVVLRCSVLDYSKFHELRTKFKK